MYERQSEKYAALAGSVTGLCGPAESLPKTWELPASLLQLERDGDAELLREVITLFRTDTQARLAKMNEVVSKGDSAEIKRQAHVLKGSTIQLGADFMALLCQQIEERACQENVSDLPYLIGQLGVEFELIWPVMAARIRE